MIRRINDLIYYLLRKSFTREINVRNEIEHSHVQHRTFYIKKIIDKVIILLIKIRCIYGTKYSRMDQVKFVKDGLKKFYLVHS